MTVPDNVCLRYADSYRRMATMGTKRVDVWSVITDLERNMSPEVDLLVKQIDNLQEDRKEATNLANYWCDKYTELAEAIKRLK